jgi:hypothetical protein
MLDMSQVLQASAALRADRMFQLPSECRIGEHRTWCGRVTNANLQPVAALVSPTDVHVGLVQLRATSGLVTS